MEDEMSRQSAKQIAGDILGYFLRSPEAADNLEGVARWRLLREAIHRSIEETSQGLEWLVRQGVLLKLATPGSEPVFCLNQAKKAQAEALLAEMLGKSQSKTTGASKAPAE